MTQLALLLYSASLNKVTVSVLHRALGKDGWITEFVA